MPISDILWFMMPFAIFFGGGIIYSMLKGEWR